MPESRSRKRKPQRGTPVAQTPSQAVKPSPSWYAPVMVALMLLGLAFIVVGYLTNMQWPIPNVQYWNLGIGIGLALVGFGGLTQWR